MDKASKILTILSEGPSEAGWLELCSVLQEVHGSTLELFISAVDPRLDNWPDELRELPENWEQKVLAGDFEKRARIARAAKFSGKNYSMEEMEKLVSSPSFRMVNSLNLNSMDMGYEEIVTLFRKMPFNRLRSLSIAGNRLGDEGISGLVGYSVLGGLDYFNLSYTGTTVIGLESITMSPNVNAQTLVLDGNKIKTGLHFLMESVFSKPKNISLRSCGINSKEVLVLNGSTIEKLDLSCNPLYSEAYWLKDLCLSQLVSLCLDHSFIYEGSGYCSFAEEAAASLAESNLPLLRELYFVGNDLRIDGARSLSKARFFSNLTKLDLGENELGNEGVREVVGCLGKVVDLNLWYNGIDDCGVRYLTEANLPSLRVLGLGGNTITEEGKRLLEKRYSLRELRT